MLKVTTSIEIEACKSFIRKNEKQMSLFYLSLAVFINHLVIIIRLKNINLNVIIFLLEFIFYRYISILFN